MISIDAGGPGGDLSRALKVIKEGDRVLLKSRDRAVAAIVSLDDLAILEAIEDHHDLAAVREALREPGSVAWDDLKASLGLP